MSQEPGFAKWYQGHQEVMRQSPIAEFFKEARTRSQHIGECPLYEYRFEASKDGAHLQVNHLPSEALLAACQEYLKSLVGIVLDCYVVFGPSIDPHQHYTAEHFKSIGKSIEDAEEELFGRRGWTDVSGVTLDYRWQMLRDSLQGCQIDNLFSKYTECGRPQPHRVASPAPNQVGWVYIPKEIQQTGNADEDINRYIGRFRAPEGKARMRRRGRGGKRGHATFPPFPGETGGPVAPRGRRTVATGEAARPILARRRTRGEESPRPPFSSFVLPP